MCLNDAMMHIYGCNYTEFLDFLTCIKENRGDIFSFVSYVCNNVSDVEEEMR